MPSIMQKALLAQKIGKKNFEGLYEEIPFLNALILGRDSFQSQAALNVMYEKVSMVFACVNKIAMNLSRVKFKIEQRVSDEKLIDITDDPEFFVLNQSPNVEQTVIDFFYETIARLVMQGEFFWELQIEKQQRKEIIAAVYADWQSEQVEVHGDVEQFIRRFRRSVNGQVYDYTPSEVFFVRQFNPYTPLRGMSPLRPLRDQMALELNALEYNKEFFERGANFPGVFTTDQDLGVDEIRRLHQELQDYYGGLRQMHFPPVLFNGLKFTSTGQMTLRDMEYDTLRKMTKEEVASVYGVPLEVLGLGEKTYENVKYARRMFWTETLIPLGDKVAATISRFFLPRLSPKEKISFRFDYSGVEALKEDQAIKAQNYALGMNYGALTINEMRVDVFNKKPLDGEEYDLPYEGRLPQQLDYETDQTQMERNAERALPSPLNGHVNGSVNGIVKREKYVAMTKSERDETWYMWSAFVKEYEPQLIEKMETFFEKQKVDVLNRIKALDANTKALAESSIYQDEKWTEELYVNALPLFVDIAKQAGNKIHVHFVVNIPATLNQLSYRVLKFAQYVNEHTGKLIQREISQYLSSGVDSTVLVGENLVELGEWVVERVFSERNNEKRSKMIARTEAVAATNFGIHEGLRQSKYPYKTWITSRESHTRDSHDIDGQTVGLDELFHLTDGRKMAYPSDFNEQCFLIGAQSRDLMAV